MRWLMIAILTLAPASAGAMSCDTPNAGRELNALLEKGRDVIVVAGTLLPPGHKPHRKGHATVTIGYRIEGLRLVPGGADQAFAGNINLQSFCVATWCPALPEDPETGVFLLRDSGPLPPLLVTGPCDEGIYGISDAARIDALRRCLTESRCGETELRLLDYPYD